MRRPRTRYVAALCAVVLFLSLQTSWATGQPRGGLSPRTAGQIEALARLKAARTPAEAKLDSSLLTTAQLRTGGRLPAGVQVSPARVTGRSGRTTVDIRSAVTADLLARVRQEGGVVRRSSRHDRFLRVELPVTSLTSVAALPEVHTISAANDRYVAGDLGGPPAPLSKTERDATLSRRLTAALDAMPATVTRRPRASVTQGSVVSQGDKAHGADAARAADHLSGIGVTVGVLSDGVYSLQNAIGSGDLPPTTRVLPGAEGQGNEGTAMLEIVHDIAPKAELVFATAANGELDFAANIRALRAAGADVIVDDFLYYSESPFQDGPIARAVADVTADGAAYFAAAGNFGNVDDRTSGNYEGVFHSSGRTVGKFAGTSHDFDPGTAIQAEDPVSAVSVGFPALLQWADPLGAAHDDYDLYAVNGDGDVVGFSNNTQDGDDDAFEKLFIPEESSVRLAVVKFGGADRYFQLSVLQGRFADDGALKAYASPGVIRGHATVPGATSVAAVPAAGPLPYDLEAGDPPNPTGPFPGVFTAAQQSERFSSDGPRRMFFTAAGQELTPGNATATGGTVRQDPDVTAADGVSTSLADYSPFFGTSAAAPHAAGLAALALSGHPGLTNTRLSSAMARASWDIEQHGPDRDTGAGVVSAARLAKEATTKGQPYVVADAPRVSTSTDHDAFLEPGETATVAVPVSNHGDVTAAKVKVLLTTTVPGITIAASTVSYGSVGADQTVTEVFTVTAAATSKPGTTVPLTARATFSGSYSPQLHTSSIFVGQPGPVVTTSYTGPPVAIPDDDPDATAVVPLAVKGVGTVSNVTFSINGTSCSTDEGSTTVGIDHAYVGDLIGTLTGPDGTVVTLFNRAGVGGHNFCRTVFDDTAPRSIELAVTEEAPYTGSWQPAEPLARLRGRPGNGTWQLKVQDASPSDSGSIRAVSVHVTGYLPAPAPAR